MKEIQTLLAELTIEEKAALLEGYQSWMTNAVPRLGIPSVYMTDGPVRKKVTSEADGAVGLGISHPATAFPASVTIANSWDTTNAEKVGQAMGLECVAQNVDVFNGMAAPSVYFEIGKTTLSVDELAHLEFIAKNILSKVEKNGKVYLTVMGSADSNTGTAKRNKQLSEARGKYVADMLTSKYGIAKDRLVVKSEVVKAAADPQLERSVSISF